MKHRITTTALLLLVLLVSSCRTEAKRVLQKAEREAEPKIAASVVTIQTVLQPQNKSYTHTVVFTSDHARIGSEVDSWRLFDLQNNAVTFVDDIEKTYRTEAVSDLLQQRRLRRGGPADGLPRPQWSRTGVRKVIAGMEAEQVLVTMGGYHRELWIAPHSTIPSQLFAMMQVSGPPPALPALTRAVDEQLLAISGFPVSDHAELTYGNKKLVVDQTVLRVENRQVPVSWLNVSSSYRELPPVAKAPAVRPRPAESRPRGRSTREGESRSSAKDRTSP